MRYFSNSGLLALGTVFGSAAIVAYPLLKAHRSAIKKDAPTGSGPLRLTGLSTTSAPLSDQPGCPARQLWLEKPTLAVEPAEMAELCSDAAMHVLMMADALDLPYVDTYQRRGRRPPRGFRRRKQHERRYDRRQVRRQLSGYAHTWQLAC